MLQGGLAAKKRRQYHIVENVMNDLLTVKDLAIQKGCAVSSVYRTAKRHGVGKIVANRLVFSVSQAKKMMKLIQDARGRPKK